MSARPYRKGEVIISEADYDELIEALESLVDASDYDDTMTVGGRPLEVAVTKARAILARVDGAK